MEDKFEDFIKVIGALEKHEVDYILIGGVAVILYGMQRLTSDVDFFVKSVPENMDKLRKALHSIYESLKYEVIDYNGIKIKIATPETLYELKKDTLRDKDKIDAVFLRELIEANKANPASEE